jgi:peptidoglycan/LPS O-acetylase OafA/YrhL
MNPEGHKREDIQVLRGIAVGLVVLFHSGVVPVRAGYLGVDIFFVISGFLITSHIVRDIDRRSFSLGGFYMRRARRLLPATYCTLLFTTVLAVFFLTPSAWGDYLKSLFGGLTFTANFFLLEQTGYFEAPSASKPLLHLWSLSVEEQFYFVLPLFLILAPRRWRLPIISVTLIASAVLCIFILPYRPATFYLLPTRVWELLIGSLLAIVVARRPGIEAPVWLKFAAMAAILIIPVFPLDTKQPGWDAVLVTCATAVLISGRDDRLRFGVVTRGLSSIGDWSYSIYLVHWPLFALANNACLGQIPSYMSALLIALSFALGYLQWRTVEQPFRTAWRTDNQRYLRYITAASMVVALPIPIYLALSLRPPGPVDFVELRRANYGLDPACAYGNSFDNKSQCRLPGTPRVALWGDSFAMHWGAGLADAVGGQGLVQLTKNSCGPIQGLSILIGNSYPKEWGRQCIGFNDSAIQYLLSAATIKTVFLAADFNDYLAPTNYLIGDSVEEPNFDRYRAEFLKTISMLRNAVKQVIVLAPPPRLNEQFNLGECLERKARGLVVLLLGRTDCSFDYESYRARFGRIIEFLQETERVTPVVWPETVLCSNHEVCITEMDDTLIYRDSKHLTYVGSVLLARKLHIADVIAPKSSASVRP